VSAQQNEIKTKQFQTDVYDSDLHIMLSLSIRYLYVPNNHV